MSGNQSDLTGLSAKPKLITRYTSGTGTYVPTADMARCLVRIQAGGGGGGYVAGTHYGGGGGAMAEVLLRVPVAGLAYSVGAGGSGTTSGAGGNGSASSFGPFAAPPGMGGDNVYTYSCGGGILESLVGSVDADSAHIMAGKGLPGVSGGAGGNHAYSGKRVGFPYPTGSPLSISPALGYEANYCTNGLGVQSGGDSFYGKGGATGNAPASDAYGAGGGSYGGAGRGGVIEIWDFGV